MFDKVLYTYRMYCVYCVYSEYSLIYCNCFQRIWWINEFGGILVVLVHHIGTGKLLQIKWFGG